MGPIRQYSKANALTAFRVGTCAYYWWSAVLTRLGISPPYARCVRWCSSACPYLITRVD